MPSNVNHYEILEIDPRASTEDIERAFKRLARKVHPDLNSGDPATAEARMKELNEVRDTLTDPLRRARYDETLNLQTNAPEPPRPFVTPAPVAVQAPDRRPWAGVLLFGLAALGGTAYLMSPSRVEGPSPARAMDLPAPDASAAPLLAVPTVARPGAPPVAAKAAVRGGRGVVHIGSSVDQVLRTFGTPDHIEPGHRAGDATFHYGKLSLEITNGRVTGGDAAAH